MRETPRALLNFSAVACLGGMLYRFIPTSIAYIPLHSTAYFPSVPELVMAAGYIAMGSVALFLLSITLRCFRAKPTRGPHVSLLRWPKNVAQSSITLPVPSTVVQERAI